MQNAGLQYAPVYLYNALQLVGTQAPLKLLQQAASLAERCTQHADASLHADRRVAMDDHSAAV
jgi:hypothetical protein